MSAAERYEELDGLRALSVLGIVTFHLFPVTALWFTVNLFFVLSGFFITGNLRESRHEPFARYLGGFYVRRAARIFPPYFLYIAVLSAIYVIFGQPELLPRYLVSLLTFTHNWTRATVDWVCSDQFTHLWSLSVEAQFYLLWPWVIALCPRRFLRLLCGAMLCLAPLWRYELSEWYVAHGIPMYSIADCVYWSTIGHLDAFAVGALIAIAMNSSGKRRYGWSRAGLWLLPIAGVANIAHLCSVYGYSDSLLASMGYPIYNTQAYQHVWSGSVLTVAWGSLTWMLVNDREGTWWLTRVLRHPWLVDIGRISYGIYLWHWLILSALQAYLPSESLPLKAFLLLPATCAVTFLIAKCSYRFVELPTLRRCRSLGKGSV
jgi:peptidoglycan/LPS O-acetylase OafA/YrhL